MTTKDDQIRILREALEHYARYAVILETYEHGAYRDDTEIASEALAATSEPVDEWRTMDSAPRDGTRILAYFPFKQGIVVIIRWTANNYSGIDWTTDNKESATMNWDMPTHWMPITPPKKENG